jgi:hypothetical protein
MTRRLAFIAGAGSMCALLACRRTSSDSAAPAPEATAEEPPDAAPGIAPARCHPTDVVMALDDGHAAGDLEFGDALSYPGGYAVGIVRPTPAGRSASVALLGRDLTSTQEGRRPRIVDLGPTLGDAPPPRIGWRPPELVAAAYTRPRDGGLTTRDVALYAIAGDVATALPIVIPQQRDDSLAFDLAFAGSAGLLAWDEATSAARGVVKSAAFSKDHASAARDLSLPGSDAELPRVAAAGAGFVVIWIARKPEPPSGLDASGPETTGEARSYGWLEMVALDARGAPTSPVRSLTPSSGHVSAFDAEVRSVDAVPLLVVVARDDGEDVDGSGGALLRVRVRGDGVEAPVAFATDGLGRGAPAFVSSSAAEPSSPFALVWVGKEEQVRLLPLDGSGAPASAISAEDAMNDARPLLFLGVPGADAAGRSSLVLVATPSDEVAPLRTFACAGVR